MKEKTKKTLLTVLLTFFLVVAGKVFAETFLTTNTTEGKIIVNKTATKENEKSDRTTNVELSVTGTEFTTSTTLDVVLVLDRSGSMNGQKMIDTKNAAQKLATDLLANNTKEKNIVKMGIVTYGTKILTDYTSTSLTSKKNQVINLIKSIPDDVNSQGTNIQGGLAKANALLASSKAQNKAVILLTDGEPTYFFHNGHLKGKGGSDTPVCLEGTEKDPKECNSTKKRPSEAAKETANTLKEKEVAIYTVGFDIEAGSDAYNFLKDVATTETDAYLAKDKEELIKNFDDIKKSMNILANNVKVEDTIPADFTLSNEEELKNIYQDKIQITHNQDGTTKITWLIGDLSAKDDLKLTYQLEAKEDYYGGMYTNINANLTGDATEGNPAYPSGKVYEEFPMPIVSIPTITEDDSYTSKLGETLIVKAETTTVEEQAGLLQNDHLIIKTTDNNSKVSNQIKITNTANSCGKLEVNTDGSFHYTPESACYGKTVTFNYQVETTVTIDGVAHQVISNPSTITITVEKDDANITEPVLTKTNKNGATTSTLNQPFEYVINYQTTIENHIGSAKVTITDTLPYAIDYENSNLDGGTYDEASKTITWEEEIKNIDTYTNGNKDVAITKNIRVVYQSIDQTAETVINKVKAKFTVDKINKETEAEDITTIKKGTVIVNYVDTNNNSLQDTITMTDVIDKEYTTSANNTITKEDVEYQLVDTKVNDKPIDKTNTYTGKYIDGTTTVTYIYYKVTGDINQETTTITKEGTDKVTSSNSEFNYTIKYHTTIDNYLGNATVTITDTLPYAIDEQLSDLNGGTYNNVSQTITWTIPTDNIDTYHNGAYEVNFEKTIKIVYKELNPSTRTITNHVSATITTDKGTDTKIAEKTTEVEIKGTVIAHYVDTNSNKLTEDVITTDLVGNDYHTTEKSFAEYVLVNTTGNPSGKYIEGTIEVTYVYYKVIGTIDQETTSIQKTGTDEVTSVTAPFNYEINYHTIVKDYIGDATITITDTLPYAIDIELSNLDGGTYNPDTHTITWIETLKNINTNLEQDKEINLTKTIQVIYLGLDPTTREVTNQVSATIQTTKTEDTKEASKTTSVNVKGTVIAHYVDTTGTPIASDETLTGLVGNEYVTSTKTVSDYVLVTTTNNTKGNYIDGTIEVTYTYYKVTGDIINGTLEKVGSEVITKTNDIFHYQINYHTNIRNYIGLTTITITDQLPYAIDVTKSYLNGGVYDPDTKTITWTITMDVNTYKTGTISIDIDKDLELAYVNLDPTAEEVTNKVSATVLTTKTEETKEDEFTTQLDIKGTVIVNYIDEYGNKIVETEILTDKVGKNYQTKEKQFDNYELIAINGKTSGTYIDGELEVVYIYSKYGKGGDTEVEVQPPQTGDTQTTSKHYLIELLLSITTSLVLLIKKWF